MSILAPTLLTDALADFQRAEADLVRHASSRLDVRTGRLTPGSCLYGCCVDPVRTHLAMSSSAFLTRPEHCVLHPECATATELLASLVERKTAYDDARRVCGVYMPSILGSLMPRVSGTLDATRLPTDPARHESGGAP